MVEYAREEDTTKTYVPVSIGPVTFGVKDTTGEKPNPNPKRVSWSKQHRITKHEIPGFSDRTMRTSVKTLWVLNLEVRTLTQDMKEKVLDLAEDPGPYPVYTALHKNVIWMYTESVSVNAVEGESDNVWTWNFTFTECRD